MVKTINKTMISKFKTFKFLTTLIMLPSRTEDKSLKRISKTFIFMDSLIKDSFYAHSKKKITFISLINMLQNKKDSFNPLWSLNPPFIISQKKFN